MKFIDLSPSAFLLPLPPCIRVSRLPFPFTFFSLSARFFSPALFPPSSDVRPTILLLLLLLLEERWKIESSSSFLLCPSHTIQRAHDFWLKSLFALQIVALLLDEEPSPEEVSSLKGVSWGTLELEGEGFECSSKLWTKNR